MSYPWLSIGLQYEGMREVPGPGVNAKLQNLWLGLPGGSWFWNHYGKDDSKLPWCGAFMARVFLDCGIQPPKRYASALEWASWGSGLSEPTLGCVVVFSREGGGHVGIVMGADELGRLIVLGGNQRDGVCKMAFDRSRATAFRFPPGVPLPGLRTMPRYASASMKLSTNEA